jgi:hypothetical protein
MRENKIYTFLFVATIISGLQGTALAGELITPAMGASYTKSTDGTRSISISLSARVDQSGKAEFRIDAGEALPKDREGYYTFDIVYGGDQSFGTVSKSVRVKDISLEMSFSKVDSVENVTVNAYTLDENGSKLAVPDIPVDFYVKRLFCLYQFGSATTDASGTCTAEFPKNMPGDSTGNVVLVAKISENDDYGTVETAKDFAGGKPLIIESRPRRGLGDTDAPLWMVYTLLVLLSGVWVHVLYVIGVVIRINILGKRALRQKGAAS